MLTLPSLIGGWFDDHIFVFLYFIVLWFVTCCVCAVSVVIKLLFHYLAWTIFVFEGRYFWIMNSYSNQALFWTAEPDFFSSIVRQVETILYPNLRLYVLTDRTFNWVAFRLFLKLSQNLIKYEMFNADLYPVICRWLQKFYFLVWFLSPISLIFKISWVKYETEGDDRG